MVRRRAITDRVQKIRARSAGRSVYKTAVLIGGACGIFLFGWAVGQGRITLLNNRPVTANKTLPDKLDYASVDEVYKLLKGNFDGKLDATKLLDGVRAGLVQAADDPYTDYMTKGEYKDFNDELTGSFSGIGAELSKVKNTITVIAPLAGSPAEKAGIRPKDAIVEIDGKTAYNLSVADAISRIRGPKDTMVKLKIVRGGAEEKTIEIKRDTINVPSVDWRVENNIGYMRISRFDDKTADLATQAANDFKRQGVKGVVLDLRGNPGGLLEAAVDVSSLWIGNGDTILSERRDGVPIRTYASVANGQPVLASTPTVVLIDEGSASASEITAGALKDHGVATLMGIKSFGKGSVQELKPLDDGGVLKVTIARWYTPNGRNIDKEGIEPDKKVEVSADDIKNGQDKQKEAAFAQFR